MRQITAGVGLGLVLLAAGCNHSPVARDYQHLPPARPTVPQLVTYLNDNAAKVQAVQANQVAIDCKQGHQSVGLDGQLVCQKPRNFRLKAKLLGQPGVDIGSNNSEFWYWISKDNPPYVYHCSYDDLARGVSIPFPFQPDMIVAALGMAEYDPNDHYELKEYPQYLELIQSARSPQGQPVQKVTVFNRNQAPPGRPQVIHHVLKDARGNLICKATIHEVQVDPTTRAVLPRKITLVWPAQKVEMRLTLYDIRAANIDTDRAARLFQRSDLSNLQDYDLAQRPSAYGSGLQRASVPPR
jgi:hypothetical protein